MMDEHMPPLGLDRLVPPPGGERRLRAALHDRATGRSGWRLPLAAAATCLCMVPVVLALRPDPADSRIRQAIEEAAAPIGGIHVAGRRVEHVASRDPGVRIYRVVPPPPPG